MQPTDCDSPHPVVQPRVLVDPLFFPPSFNPLSSPTQSRRSEPCNVYTALFVLFCPPLRPHPSSSRDYCERGEFPLPEDPTTIRPIPLLDGLSSVPSLLSRFPKTALLRSTYLTESAPFAPPLLSLASGHSFSLRPRIFSQEIPPRVCSLFPPFVLVNIPPPLSLLGSFP